MECHTSLSHVPVRVEGKYPTHLPDRQPWWHNGCPQLSECSNHGRLKSAPGDGSLYWVHSSAGTAQLHRFSYISMWWLSTHHWLICQLTVCSVTGLTMQEAPVTTLYLPPSARPLHETKNTKSPGFRNKQTGKLQDWSRPQMSEEVLNGDPEHDVTAFTRALHTIQQHASHCTCTAGPKDQPWFDYQYWGTAEENYKTWTYYKHHPTENIKALHRRACKKEGEHCCYLWEIKGS